MSARLMLVPDDEFVWTEQAVESIIWPIQADGTRLYFGENRKGRFAMFRKVGDSWLEHHECDDAECALLDTLEGVIVTWSERLRSGALVATEWDWCL